MAEFSKGLEAGEGSIFSLETGTNLPDASRSSTLPSTLLEHGLADEVFLIVYPVLLGKGKRFFAEGTPARAFELASTKALPSGIVISAYKFAGPLKNQP